MKIVNKYEIYNNNYAKATENNEESATNKTRAQQIEIKNIVEMYGMEGLVAKWQASEPLYVDMTQAVTVENALELRQKINEYFENMPARARKIFGDNPDLFYEKFRNGEFDGFIDAGALTEELEDHYKRIIKERNNGKIQEIFDDSSTNSEVNTANNKVDNTTVNNSETSN